MSFAAFSAGLADAHQAIAPFLFSVDGRRSGTAVAWETPGLLVTAAHVVGRADKVTLRSGRLAIEATVVGRDRASDLAVLRVDVPAAEAKTPAPQWLADDDLRVAELVLAVGRPGPDTSVALGVISSLGGPWWTSFGAPIDRFIDIDGRLPDGFSGGVLLGSSGAILGLNTHAHLPGGAVLPTSTVRRIVASLVAHGRVRRGYLGVAVQSASTHAGGTTQHGLLVTGVKAGEPGALGGLATGDLILKVHGRVVTHAAHLLGALSDRAGESTRVGVLRGGVPVEVEVLPSERTEVEGGCQPRGCR